MSRFEDDRIAEELAGHAEARVAAEARYLTGGEVLQLRHAIDAATKALRQVNTKGLPFAHRRDAEMAKTALDDARRLVTKAVPSVQQTSEPR